MATVFLGLGSNLGDREANVRTACERIASQPGIRLRRVSSLYLTAPIGYVDQPDFVNAVAVIETKIEPVDLLHVVQGIEREMGRVRNFRWGPRVIDIDVLVYDGRTVDTPELTIPHPRMMERAFVMAPLSEIAPDIILPDGRKPGEVSQELRDQCISRLPEAKLCRSSDTR